MRCIIESGCVVHYTTMLHLTEMDDIAAADLHAAKLLCSKYANIFRSHLRPKPVTEEEDLMICCKILPGTNYTSTTVCQTAFEH